MAVTSHVGPTRAEPESSLGTQVPAQADIQRVTNCLEAEVTQVRETFYFIKTTLKTFYLFYSLFYLSLR